MNLQPIQVLLRLFCRCTLQSCYTIRIAFGSAMRQSSSLHPLGETACPKRLCQFRHICFASPLALHIIDSPLHLQPMSTMTSLMDNIVNETLHTLEHTLFHLKVCPITRGGDSNWLLHRAFVHTRAAPHNFSVLSALPSPAPCQAVVDPMNKICLV